jgi:tRNA 2-(methylsulfanyl)-N6-isopentenyladenosine37 hydroxylase
VSPMLNLAAATDPGWTARALAEIDEVLVDHAHCEKKAASSALSLLFKYPERHELGTALARLAREELGHFEEVVAHVAARGGRLHHLVPSPYAAGLMRAIRPHEPARLLDTLCCLALIEARSCERMTLLAGALADTPLAGLYRGLLASEARHHAAYVELAAGVAPRPEVRARLRELALHEAAVLAAVPPMARIHA